MPPAIKHSPSFVQLSMADQCVNKNDLEIPDGGLNQGAFPQDSFDVQKSVPLTHPRDVTAKNSSDDLASIANASRGKIGEWILGKTIGEGASGKVKMAYHSQTHESVIKLFVSNVSKCVVKAVRRPPMVKPVKDKPIDAKALQRIHKRELLMIREAALGMVLSHPNIVRLHSTVLGERHFYCFFEYVPGKDLVDYIGEVGRLREIEARSIFRQLLSAIGMTHCISHLERIFTSQSCHPP